MTFGIIKMCVLSMPNMTYTFPTLIKYADDMALVGLLKDLFPNIFFKSMR